MEGFKIELVEFGAEFLELSWNWLQDEEIRRMISAPAITREQQTEWYNSIRKKADYLIWGINVNNVPVGATGLKKITMLDGEYWGYIGEKDYWGKGIGLTVMEMLETIAVNKGLESIWLRVYKDNTRAFNLYKKLNYAVEGSDNALLIMRKML